MIRFDQAVTTAARATHSQMCNPKSRITLVRDVGGQLTVVLPDDALPPAAWDNLAQDLHDSLGPYSPGPKLCLLRESDLISRQDVVESPDAVRLPEFESTWLVDRVLTNQDWLRQPLQSKAAIPVAVAFSVKGGVGRSTSLAVLAWHLARSGKKVLAVDLDLEAPGLGSLLLDELPDYGLADWLVETLVTRPEPAFLEDCIAPSRVAQDTPGMIHVIPSFGRHTRDYIAKLGRLFLPQFTAEGTEEGFAARFIHLMKLLRERQEPPDVILVDARAGLHDIGAAAVTQLGAEVFLFARNDPQGWQAYRLLFEHLARSRGIAYGMPAEDLRWRLKMVAAQIDKTEGAFDDCLEASYEAWAALYDDESSAEPDEAISAQTFSRNDTNAPHYPVPVFFDSSLRGATLIDRSDRLPWSVAEATFGEFLDAATARLVRDPEESTDGDGMGELS